MTDAKVRQPGSCLLQVALKAFEILSPIYTYVFLLVRSVVAPPVMVWFAMTLMNATKLPFACRYVSAALPRKLHYNHTDTAHYYWQIQQHFIRLDLWSSMSVRFAIP